MNDTPTLVRFYSGWERDGNGPDGLPTFRETVRVRLDRPPYLSVERVAEETDITDHPMPYELYRKTSQGCKEIVGYPLVLWPACLPHLFQMCAARDIHTVEQLAQLVTKKRRSEAVKTIPPEIIELADRATRMIELQSKAGQYEELVTNLQSQIEVLKEQVTEAVATISAQKTLIETLKLKAVA
jgi:Tfp pilus assembly major pilin PilA